ncbi:TIGR03943 family putative permease subunit [Mesobacillus maritimus]|uniref:TIGR03943 family putative permease subunit n=1 Tax=Mesobacillus maritimus TaxID=1643336 RepID=UPI00384A4F22
MNFHFQQALRALILLAFMALILKLHLSDEITKFINPKYIRLSQVASVLFLILFLIQITRIWTTKQEHHHTCNHEPGEDSCHHHHDHGDSPFTMRKFISYSIVVFPLLTGFFLPAKVLDASIVDKKGGMAVLANQKQKANGDEDRTSVGDSAVLPEDSSQTSEEEPIEDYSYIEENAVLELEYENLMSKEEYDQLIHDLKQSNKIDMEDSVFAAFYDEIASDLDHYKGKEIELTGMVYKEDGLEQNQLVLSRFLITHCVADASIIGFLSEIPESTSIDQDTWIQAKGVLDVTTFNGVELPIIKVTNWKEVEEPKEPYLYPISIKIL